MVVMITPVSFAEIGYQTYIIFAVINAFMIPAVYFFFPETAYRSLEEMDEIFRQSTSVFDVVRLADPKVTPNRYDKHGQLVISYLETEEHRRRASAVSGGGVGGEGKKEVGRVERKAERGDEAVRLENGYASGSGASSGVEKV